jgi:hypothetical protein
MDGFYGTQEKMGSVVASSSYYAPDPSTSLILNRGKFSSTYVDVSRSQVDRGLGDSVSLLTDPEDFAKLNEVTNTVVSNAWSRISASVPRNDFNSNILCPHPSSVLFTYPTFAKYTNINSNTGVGDSDIGFTVLADGESTVGSRSFLENLEPRAAAFYYGIIGSGITSYHCNSGVVDLQPDTPSTTINNELIQGYDVYRGQHYSTQGQVYGETQVDFVKRQEKWKKAIRKAFFGGSYSDTKHQIVDPSKPNFMSPTGQHTGRYSTFMLGFDLDTFSHNTDTIRSGHYLGNNTVSLNLSTFAVQDNSPCNMPLMQSVRMDTYVLHDLRLSFQAGGIVQAFY